MSRNELYHYGVLGQRWGIRRYQNKDGTLTTAGRKRYSSRITLDKAYKSVAKTDESKASSLTKVGSDENKVRTHEIVIQKGTQLNRISTVSDESKAKALYTNFAKNLYQIDYYKKDWPYQVDSITEKKNDWYSNTFKVNADIVAPSLERRKQAMNAVVNADEKMRNEFGKQVALRSLSHMANLYIDDEIPMKYTQSFAGIRKYYKDYAPAYKNLLSKTKSPKVAEESYKETMAEIDSDIKNAIRYYNELKKKRFDAFNESDFDNFKMTLPRSKKIMNAYIKELKKDGFDAVFDDNAGAKSAFIIFDAKNLDQVSSEKFDVDYSHITGDDPEDAFFPWLTDKK